MLDGQCRMDTLSQKKVSTIRMLKRCLLEATTYPSNNVSSTADEKCVAFAKFMFM